jgi:ORF6N domain
MANELIITDDLLVSRILELRGQKIMIDKDLAELYSVTTKRLNEQVKRNNKRFPIDFMFQLTKDEKNDVVAKCDHLKNLKFSPNLPYAFTEHGAVMLASILNSDKAIEVNVRIVKMFNAMRFVLQSNHSLLLKLEQLDKKIINIGFDVKMHDGDIETLFELIKDIMEAKNKPAPKREPIGFKTKATTKAQNKDTPNITEKSQTKKRK